jgi:hypothetical protein
MENIIPFDCHLKFKSFKIADDIAVYVRQPHAENPIYQVLMEDAYGNATAQMMTPAQLWEKWKIKL